MKIYIIVGQCRYFSIEFNRYMTEEEIIGAYRTKKEAEDYIEQMGNDEENHWGFGIVESWLVPED